ncbi:hypothetical protein EMPS_02300 [Entomortierella parvispora]|uniref:SAP domain-containing protein n=1 Tax=Entomortierella parvispora TaxID=205924 RepID=A0A9P3H4G3_9FUNG|nr:hypothetical protein EMPS_02300 [Entomortierella parvispora]
MVDPNTLKVTELKTELTARGLSTKGLKKELVTRLEEALATETQSTSASDTPMDTDNVTKEAEQISQIVEPVEEPVAAAAESDIVMAPVPAPDDSVSSTPAPDVLSSVEVSTTVLEPVVGTPTLSQEGVVDTTTTTDATSTPSTSTTNTATTVDSSKKRSLESDDATSHGPAKDSVKRTRQDSGAEDHARIRAAATEAVEADARRRSAAPSPSPAPGRSASVASIAPSSEENAQPGSPDKVSATAPRRIDARSLMERQIKMAVQDRQPEAALQSPVELKPTPALPSVTEDADGETDSSADASRSLVITNFVRPLTVNQVKRMLAEFGEIEMLWMDSIRTHCYVTFKTVESAKQAFKEVVGQVFPKETGKALEAMYLSPETAAQCVEAAEEAQKNGRKPVIYTGKAAAIVTPKRGAPIAVRNEEVEVIFKRNQAEPAQVVQPTDLFKMTTAQPALYYKALKEPPVETPSETVN